MILRWLFGILILIFAIAIAIIADHDGSSDPLDWLRDSIPGEPGVDYPVFSEVTETEFSCNGRIFGGYYADPEMQCQQYHVCLTPPNAFMDRKTSFLCPNGTVFSQSLLTCDWWFNVDCTETEDFYSINEKIGSTEPISNEDSISSEPAPDRQRPQSSQTNQKRRRPQNQQQPQAQRREGQKPQGQRSQAQRPQQGRRPQGQRPKQSEAASQGRGGQTSNNRPQNQLRGQDTSFGVGSASIQSRNNNQPQIDIDIVQYDATIPDEDEDVDVPILLADPFNEAAERPLTLYGAPPRGR